MYVKIWKNWSSTPVLLEYCSFKNVYFYMHQVEHQLSTSSYVSFRGPFCAPHLLYCGLLSLLQVLHVPVETGRLKNRVVSKLKLILDHCLWSLSLLVGFKILYLLAFLKFNLIIFQDILIHFVIELHLLKW